MTLDDSIQGFRLRVLREAQWRGNVSASGVACVDAMTCLARCSIAGALGWCGMDLTGCIRSGGQLGPGVRRRSAWRTSGG